MSVRATCLFRRAHEHVEEKKQRWATLPDVIVNCAAMSSPAACEREPAACEAVNCPVGLMECMYASVPDALFVHFSTDIVHAGCETAGAEPYGDAGAGGVDKARRARRPACQYARRAS